MSAKDREQFAPVEMSDGAMRPWFLRDEDRRRSLVYGVGAVAFALLGLVVTTGSRTEYKVVAYKPSLYEHVGSHQVKAHYDIYPDTHDIHQADHPSEDPADPEEELPEEVVYKYNGKYVSSANEIRIRALYSPSGSSFIDVVKREGVDDATIFETCLYPTVTAEFRTYYGHDLTIEPDTTSKDLGKPVNQVEAHQFGCVWEKLLNKLAESNWKFVTSETIMTEKTFYEMHMITFSRKKTTF